MHFKLIRRILLSLSLLWSPAALAGYPSQFPPITTGNYPLPDQSVAPAYIWIEQNCASNPSNCDFAISPQQLGYPQQTTAAPSSPYLFQPWWNTGTNKQYEYYDGSQWIPTFGIDTTNHLYEGIIGGGLASTIAGNTTTDLCANIAQSSVTVSGTATIASFGSTCAAGIIKLVTFSGVSVLQQNSTSMQLPGSANITTANGDTAIVQSLGSANYKVINYESAATGCVNCVTNPSPALTGVPTAPTAAPGTNTTQIATTAFVTSAVPQLLTSNIILYVSPTGSDTSNNCLSSSTPCATFQNAFNVLRSTYNLNGNTATIQEVNCGGGTYSGSTIMSGLLPGQIDANHLIIEGNISSPDTCVVTSANVGFQAEFGAAVTIEGFKISALDSDVVSSANAVVNVGYIDFGATTNYYELVAIHKGLMYAFANLTVSGSSVGWVDSDTESVIFLGATGPNFSTSGGAAWTPITVSLIGTPAFSIATVNVQNLSLLTTGPSGNVTFSGSATGQRYGSAQNSVIQTNNGGCPSTYFPGSISGATATGGQCL